MTGPRPPAKRPPRLGTVRSHLAPFAPPGTTGKLALLVALTFVSGLAEAGTLVLVARMALAVAEDTDEVTLGAGLSASRGTLALIAAGALACKLAANVAVAVVSSRLAAATAVHARGAVLRSYFGANWEQQSEERLGALQEFLVTSVNQLTAINSAYVTAMAAIINFSVIIVVALIVNPVAALCAAAAASALIALLRPLTAIAKRNTRKQHGETILLAGSITEAVRMTQEARAFGVRGGVLGSLEARARNLQAPQQRQLFMQRLAPAVYQTSALAFVVIAVVVAGAFGGGDVGSLGATVVLLLRGLGYGQQLQSALQQLAAAVPYVEALHERRARYDQALEHPGTETLDRVGEIRLDHLSFSYRTGHDVLSDLDVRIGEHEAVGVVGPSGSGKSTLVQLLLRLRPPTAGSILVNGVDLWDVRDDEWRRLTSFVPQDAKMLHATVSENIAFFRDVPADEIERAARLAHIHDDILSWPDGYDTHIGEAGNKISGGQRQRLAFARALVSRPQLLVLDEPTSALDLQSEARLQATLRDIKGTTGLVIVAHRVSTITLCDRILVLRAGEVEGFDRHDVLLRESPFYREALRLSTLQEESLPAADDVVDGRAPGLVSRVAQG